MTFGNAFGLALYDIHSQSNPRRGLSGFRTGSPRAVGAYRKQLLYDWSHLICSVDSLVLIVVFGRATPACCLRPVMNPATLPLTRTWR